MMSEPRTITAELRKWWRSEPNRINGEIWNDKLNIFLDGTIRHHLEIKWMSDEGDHFVLRTPAYLYKLMKSEEIEQTRPG